MYPLFSKAFGFLQYGWSIFHENEPLLIHRHVTQRLQLLLRFQNRVCGLQLQEVCSLFTFHSDENRLHIKFHECLRLRGE